MKTKDEEIQQLREQNAELRGENRILREMAQRPAWRYYPVTWSLSQPLNGPYTVWPNPIITCGSGSAGGYAGSTSAAYAGDINGSGTTAALSAGQGYGGAT